MRNMIFKTLFASILSSLFIAPLAHADRQGGGTLRAIVGMSLDVPNFDDMSVMKPKVYDIVAVEKVRFISAKNNELLFLYSRQNMGASDVQEMSLTREQINFLPKNVLDALSVSKKADDWQLLGIDNPREDLKAGEFGI